jgi:hypothetical protein
LASTGRFTTSLTSGDILITGTTLTFNTSGGTQVNINVDDSQILRFGSNSSLKPHILIVANNFVTQPGRISLRYSNFTSFEYVDGTNTTERVRITTAGNVGINTTIPTYTLDVNGSLRATSGDITIGTLLATTSISTGAINTTNITSTNIVTTTLSTGTLNASNITSGIICTGTIIITAGTLNASFNSNTLGNLFTTTGNVGINTTSPNSPLHILRNVGSGYAGIGKISRKRSAGIHFCICECRADGIVSDDDSKGSTVNTGCTSARINGK